MITIGRTILEPRLDADVTYNDNVFATPNNRRGDAVFQFQPSVTVQRQVSTFDLKGSLRANLIRYAKNDRENVDTVGARAQATKTIGNRQSLAADAGFDRTYERRSDPEARNDPARPPALVNLTTGELRYRYDGARFGLVTTLAANHIDYLRSIDVRRDLRTYRATARLSLRVAGWASLYLEPFAHRVDFRLPEARGGVTDRTTFGVLSGVSLDLADRLTGNLGVGAFRSNPDGSQFSSFTGFGASGRLLWRPRTRTAVVFDVFRGDVATVRLGATGRIDTRVALSVDQEVRHNLLLHAAAGFRDVSYRGRVGGAQRYASGQVEARYLLNRHWSVALGADYQQRTADFPNERFRRFRGTLGLRFVY